MSLALKITLSILTLIFINGCTGIGLWYGKFNNYVYPFDFGWAKHAIASIILMALAICYIPFMFIWHLY